MQFKYLTEQQAWDSVVSCNRAYYGRELPAPLYELLERSGYDYRQCVFVDSCPDGGDDSFGRLIGPRRELLCYELYPDDPDASSVEEFPLTPGGPNGLPRGVKPISELAMALRYYELYVAGKRDVSP